MKKIVVFVVFLLFALAGVYFLWSYLNKQDALTETPENIIAAEYPEKIVYNQVAGDNAEFKADCKVRKGQFNECGSSCEKDASFCVAMCVPICEFEETIKYKNETLGFELNYPEQIMQVDANETDTVRFLISGEMQQGPEFIDGLRFTVTKEKLEDKADLGEVLKTDVAKKVLTGNLSTIEVDKIKGYTYTEKNVESITHVYLPKGYTVFHLAYSVADPKNKNYSAVAAKMVESFKIY